MVRRRTANRSPAAPRSATLTSGWTSHVHHQGRAVPTPPRCGELRSRASASRNIWLAFVFLAVAGAADMVSGVFRSPIWNQTIPDGLRGRSQALSCAPTPSDRSQVMRAQGWWPVHGMCVDPLCLAGFSVLPRSHFSLHHCVRSCNTTTERTNMQCVNVKDEPTQRRPRRSDTQNQTSRNAGNERVVVRSFRVKSVDQRV